jgi:hypothetical protein
MIVSARDVAQLNVSYILQSAFTDENPDTDSGAGNGKAADATK